jgi:CHASE1-domain containing sensor protein
VRKRLVTSTAAIALASVIVLGVPLGLVEAARVRSDATNRLEREADAVASAIDDRLESHQPISAAALMRFVRPGHRAVIVSRAGRLTWMDR